MLIAILGLGLVLGQSLWEDYALNQKLRASAQEIQTRAMVQHNSRRKLKPKPAPKRKDIVPLEEVAFGGRSLQWWTRRMQSLRIKERSAPSEARPQIRIRLIDTERKARAFKIPEP